MAGSNEGKGDQGNLPGHERTEHPDVVKAAKKYVALRDDRMETGVREEKARASLHSGERDARVGGS